MTPFTWLAILGFAAFGVASMAFVIWYSWPRKRRKYRDEHATARFIG